MPNVTYFCRILREYRVNFKWDNIGTYSLLQDGLRLDNKWTEYHEILTNSRAPLVEKIL